jgi:hypothetical protein
MSAPTTQREARERRAIFDVEMLADGFRRMGIPPIEAIEMAGRIRINRINEQYAEAESRRRVYAADVEQHVEAGGECRGGLVRRPPSPPERVVQSRRHRRG